MIRDLVLDLLLCLLLLYGNVPFTCNFSTRYNTQNTFYITWYLLNVNNICDLLRNALRATNWVIHGMPSYPYFYRKETLKYSILSPEESGWGWQVDSNNFAYITTKLGNLCWKRCLLMEKNIHEIPRLKFFLIVIWILQSGFFLGACPMIMIYTKKHTKEKTATHISLSSLI